MRYSVGFLPWPEQTSPAGTLLQYKAVIGAAQYAPAGRNAREIVGAVEADLREGRVRPGERLPPVRALAGALGVSPATVAAAYRQLRERGVVVADGRRGTTVSRRPPLAHHLPSVLPPGTRDLASGHPDPELLPAWPERTPSTRLYGMAPVAPRLEKLARRQFEEEG